MTTQACFTDAEARSHVGALVETTIGLPQVPNKTRGRVVSADFGGPRGWLVKVEWDLPAKRSEVMAQLGEFSFNLPWRSKVPVTDFSKSEFKDHLKVVGRSL